MSRRWRIALLSLSALLTFPSSVMACASVSGESAVVKEIADDGTLTLDDGRSVKLAGIEILRGDAASLGKLTGQQVTLHYGSTRIDRYGRALALVSFGKGPSLQEELLAEGRARVTPSGDMRLCAAEFLAAEAQARAARRGLWRDPAFAVRQAEDLAGLEALDGTYQLVEGKVAGISKIRGRIYFNFGEDWRTDFTVTVVPADAKLFQIGAWDGLTGKNPAIVGARIRVRGFLSRYNGPGMTIAVPEQIELLDRPMPGEGMKAADEGDERKTSEKKPHRARRTAIH